MTSPTWSISPDVAYVEEETQVVLVDLTRLTEPPRILAGSAAVIWVALEVGGRREDEVIAEVAEAFDVEPQLIEADVRGFLSELAAEGLAIRG